MFSINKQDPANLVKSQLLLVLYESAWKLLERIRREAGPTRDEVDHSIIQEHGHTPKGSMEYGPVISNACKEQTGNDRRSGLPSNVQL